MFHRFTSARSRCVWTGIFSFVCVSLCAGNAFAQILYWSEGGFGAGVIKRADLRNLEASETIVTADHAISVLALDDRRNKLYWTGDGLLQRSTLNGDEIETLSSGFGFSEGLALDPSADALYWSTWSGTLRRAALDGTGESIVFTDFQQLFGLALDSASSQLYWTADDTGIYRGDIDGANQEFLVDGGSEPLGIVLDFAHQRMYWTDWLGMSVWRANLDGSQREQIYTSRFGNPIGITLDPIEDNLYWTEWGTNAIMRAAIDGSGVEQLGVMVGTPWGIQLAPIPAPGAFVLLIAVAAFSVSRRRAL